MQGGSKQASKQAPKPSFSLPSLGGKASQQGKKAKGQAKQVSKQASKPTLSLPSVGGKASQVGKTAKVKAGSAPQKAKKAVSSGTSFLGTGSTRGKSAPAKAGRSLGTRTTRPGHRLHAASTCCAAPACIVSVCVKRCITSFCSAVLLLVLDHRTGYQHCKTRCLLQHTQQHDQGSGGVHANHCWSCGRHWPGLQIPLCAFSLLCHIADHSKAAKKIFLLESPAPEAQPCSMV